MKLGICLPHYGRPIEVGRMLDVVNRAEEGRLDSVWVDGIHHAAVDMALLRGRPAITGPVKRVVEALQGFRALGCAHVALEVSYSTYPAILETIDVLANEVRPQVAD